jgi:adenylylsulfate kinase
MWYIIRNIISFEVHNMSEARTRAIAKTISWRILATATTIALVYLFTKRIDLSLEVGALELVCKLILYYFHERGWSLIHWGYRQKQ